MKLRGRVIEKNTGANLWNTLSEQMLLTALHCFESQTSPIENTRSFYTCFPSGAPMVVCCLHSLFFPWVEGVQLNSKARQGGDIKSHLKEQLNSLIPWTIARLLEVSSGK